MLIMPGIVTGRRRGFLLTMFVCLLIEGLVNSINYNINKIIESTVCMYKLMKNIACYLSEQIPETINYTYIHYKLQINNLRFIYYIPEISRYSHKVRDYALCDII